MVVVQVEIGFCILESLQVQFYLFFDLDLDCDNFDNSERSAEVSGVQQLQLELIQMNISSGLVLSGQVPSLQSKNWIGNLLKMNYFEFSFRENEISASKLGCMATAVGWIIWTKYWFSFKDIFF